MRVLRVLSTVSVVVVLGALVAHSGAYLVVDQPVRSDAIVVLGGDYSDLRYRRGIELLRSQYGKQMVLDVPTRITIYGHTPADYAADHLRRSDPDVADGVTICSIREDSTMEEAADVRGCLQGIQPRPTSILLVTHDFHTRRALTIFRHRLPQYRWSAAAVRDRVAFGQRWWTRGLWATTALTEWQKLLWWTLVEQWRDSS